LAFIDKNGGGPGYLGPVTTLCTKIRWVSAALTPCVNGRHRSNFFGGFAMLPELRVLLEDEPCPVLDETLGEMYRASAHGLSQIITTISPAARVLLAIYCYRRAHLASIGLAIAATCEKYDLGVSSRPLFSGKFEKNPSRGVSPIVVAARYVVSQRRLSPLVETRLQLGSRRLCTH